MLICQWQAIVSARDHMPWHLTPTEAGNLRESLPVNTRPHGPLDAVAGKDADGLTEAAQGGRDHKQFRHWSFPFRGYGQENAL